MLLVIAALLVSHYCFCLMFHFFILSLYIPSAFSTCCNFCPLTLLFFSCFVFITSTQFPSVPSTFYLLLLFSSIATCLQPPPLELSISFNLISPFFIMYSSSAHLSQHVAATFTLCMSYHDISSSSPSLNH